MNHSWVKHKYYSIKEKKEANVIKNESLGILYHTFLSTDETFHLQIMMQHDIYYIVYISMSIIHKVNYVVTLLYYYKEYHVYMHRIPLCRIDNTSFLQ